MSTQIMDNNIYTTAPASLNPYISRKLNNIDQAQVMKREMSRSLTVDFIFYFLFSLYFFFLFFLFLFLSIFRTTRVRIYQSHCHISHKLMARSQDWSQDLGEWSRRFWNKVTSYNMDYTCWPHVIHMVIQGRMHSSEHGP